MFNFHKIGDMKYPFGGIGTLGRKRPVGPIGPISPGFDIGESVTKAMKDITVKDLPKEPDLRPSHQRIKTESKFSLGGNKMMQSVVNSAIKAGVVAGVDRVAYGKALTPGNVAKDFGVVMVSDNLVVPWMAKALAGVNVDPKIKHTVVAGLSDVAGDWALSMAMGQKNPQLVKSLVKYSVAETVDNMLLRPAMAGDDPFQEK